MITVTINVSRIDESTLYDGKNGKYLTLTLFENTKGPDQFGNHGFVTQDIGKERRESGEKGPILGNYKVLDQNRKPKLQNSHNQAKSNGYQPQPQNEDDDQIPF